MKSFEESIARYEGFMRERFGPALQVEDLKRKHRRMRESPFLFLRATCWRWAEGSRELCPELLDAPVVGSVGDAHAGNFGLWRDDEGRVVWGVNDFDEAARLPYPLELVRLTASLLLAEDASPAEEVADQVLDGYRSGLERPSATVLEADHLWLLDAFTASDARRTAFWGSLQAAPHARAVPPELAGPLLKALPAETEDVRVLARSAGAGSLGRPRYVACGRWKGGPAAREIKGRLPSCWASGPADDEIAARLATGAYRAPDPFLVFGDGYVLRRLAPNSRKLRFAELSRRRGARLVQAMARELAAVHAGAGAPGHVLEDLGARPKRWLERAARRVAKWTLDEYSAYHG